MTSRLWVFLLCLFCAVAWSQSTASMEVPVIRPDGEKVVVSAKFSNLTPGSRYRLGLGAAGGGLQQELGDVTFEVRREGSGDSKVVELPVSGFTQAHNWWGADKLFSRGCELDGALLAGGSALVLRVEFSREFGDKAEKLYVFVAKNYGQDTWYIEDGAEMTKTYW